MLLPFFLFHTTFCVAIMEYSMSMRSMKITLICQIMITMWIETDRHTYMPSKTECSPRQTTVANHYSLACVNSFQTYPNSSDRYKQMFIGHYYSLACVKRDLIDSQTNYCSSIIISIIFYSNCTSIKKEVKKKYNSSMD